MRTKLLCIVLGAAVVAGCVAGCGREKQDPAKVYAVLDIIKAMFGGMPEDYPDDIPVYPGLRGIHADKLEYVYTLIGATSDSPGQVAAFFKDALPKNEWTEAIPSELPDEGEYMEYTKGQRLLSIYVSTDKKSDFSHLVVNEFPQKIPMTEVHR